ncbi:cytoplasmic tRNA 2-thiolation protein [Thalictrum thalictroides]|uniref:Cytoplasmic tRNA 2-thiolation protein n=1 Tax=Thalictrum thalictroides TaxID=46969 RepID=A0A7J6V692_THATH|nr:cytoplasmic tRNA 2-thiolation protein [Thalictrum thalictroides]
MAASSLKWLVHSVCASTFGYPKDLFNTNGDDQLVYKKSNMNPKCTNGTESFFKEEETCNKGNCPTMFQMPLHYPRYKKADYDKMEEWKVDMLLKQYGICCDGTVDEKRSFAMGAFLWPDQY